MAFASSFQRRDDLRRTPGVRGHVGSRPPRNVGGALPSACSELRRAADVALGVRSGVSRLRRERDARVEGVGVRCEDGGRALPPMVLGRGRAADPASAGATARGGSCTTRPHDGGTDRSGHRGRALPLSRLRSSREDAGAHDRPRDAHRQASRRRGTGARRWNTGGAIRAVHRIRRAPFASPRVLSALSRARPASLGAPRTLGLVLPRIYRPFCGRLASHPRRVRGRERYRRRHRDSRRHK